MRPGSAVIIFAKAPGADAKTRLSSVLSDSERIALYESLLRETVEKLMLVDDADLCIFYTPSDAAEYFRQFQVALWSQVLGDLGQRMHAAFDRMFRHNYGKAVLVGVDIPGLTAPIIRHALYLLNDHDAVFGPATDGGYYLVGLKRSAPALFEGIHWSCPSTLCETLRKAQSLGLRVALTAELSDIDTADDAKRSGLLDWEHH